MEINKTVIVNKIQKLIDLNNGVHKFNATFSLSSERPFTMAIADMDNLEHAEYKQIEGEIEGEIDYYEEKEKDFYILLKAPEDTSVNIKIVINDLKNEVLNKKEMDENNIEEMPQHTGIDDIFEAEGHPKQAMPQQPHQQMQMPPQMQYNMQPNIPISDDDDKVEDNSIVGFCTKHKSYIIAATVLISAYYIYKHPEITEKIKNVFVKAPSVTDKPSATPKIVDNISATLDGLDI